MSHYGNLSYWRDLGPSTKATLDSTDPWKEHVDQLACRALVQMVQIGVREGEQQRGIMPADMRSELYDDAMATCCRFIRALYDRSGKGQTAGCFLNAYDLIAATVCYINLRARKSAEALEDPGIRVSDQAELMEVVHKASILVTQIASRFPALDGFHRLFLTLSSRAVGDQVSEDSLLPFSYSILLNCSFSDICRQCLCLTTMSILVHFRGLSASL